MAVSPSVLNKMKYDAGYDLDMESFNVCEPSIQNIIQLLDDSHLRKFVSTREKVPIDELKEWAFTATSTATEIKGSIRGVEVSIHSSMLTEVFELVNGNDHLELSSEAFENALQRMQHSGNPKKLHKVDFAPAYRFLADIVGKVLLGKSSGHDYINRQQFCLMMAVLDRKQLNWEMVLFDNLRKKVGKDVGMGRVFAILLSSKVPELLTGHKVFINASKKINSSLFGKWQRVIPRKLPLPAENIFGESSGMHSEDPRTDAVIPQSSEELLPPPSNLPPPSPEHLQASPQHSASPHSHADELPQTPPSQRHIIFPEENLFSSPPPSSHAAIQTSFSSTSSSSQKEGSPTPSHPPATTQEIPVIIPLISDPIPPISSTPEATTSHFYPMVNVDLSSFADQVFGHLYPKIEALLDLKLTPIAQSLASLSQKIDSSSSHPTVVPSSGGQDSGIPEFWQGERSYEEGPCPMDISGPGLQEPASEALPPAAVTAEIPPSEVVTTVKYPQFDTPLEVLFDLNITSFIRNFWNKLAPLTSVPRMLAPPLQIIPYQAPAALQEVIPPEIVLPDVVPPPVASEIPVSQEIIMESVVPQAVTPSSSPPTFVFDDSQIPELDDNEIIPSEPKETEEPKAIKASLPETKEVLLKKLDSLYENPNSSDDEPSEDSDESDSSKKRKRKAVAKPPPKSKADNDIPYYKLHNLTLTDKSPYWWRLSKNEAKRRKKIKKTGFDPDLPAKKFHHPPPPPPPAAASPSLQRAAPSQPFSQYSRRQGSTSSAPLSSSSRTGSKVSVESEKLKDPAYVSQMARFKETVALAQISKARAEGKDFSGISTLSEFRLKELEMYKPVEGFSAEEYLRLHPEAVVPHVREKKILGEEDLYLSKRQAENPNREIRFKPASKKE